MKQPYISIIIPSHNDSAFVEKNLEILSGVDDWEVIVVESGTADYRAKDCTYIKSAVSNRAVQMNIGAEHARGDLLLFLHADTFIPPSSIKHLYKYLEANPNYIGGMYRFSLDSDSWKAQVIEIGVHMREKILGLSYGDQCIFVWKNIFKQVGGFPEEPVFEDALFLRKLRSQGDLYSCPHRAVTSARKWEDQGYVKTTFQHNVQMAKMMMGVPPRKLAV